MLISLKNKYNILKIISSILSIIVIVLLTMPIVKLVATNGSIMEINGLEILKGKIFESKFISLEGIDKDGIILLILICLLLSSLLNIFNFKSFNTIKDIGSITLSLIAFVAFRDIVARISYNHYLTESQIDFTLLGKIISMLLLASSVCLLVNFAYCKESNFSDNRILKFIDNKKLLKLFFELLFIILFIVALFTPIIKIASTIQNKYSILGLFKKPVFGSLETEKYYIVYLLVVSALLYLFACLFNYFKNNKLGSLSVVLTGIISSILISLENNISIIVENTSQTCLSIYGYVFVLVSVVIFLIECIYYLMDNSNTKLIRVLLLLASILVIVNIYQISIKAYMQYDSSSDPISTYYYSFIDFFNINSLYSYSILTKYLYMFIVSISALVLFSLIPLKDLKTKDLICSLLSIVSIVLLFIFMSKGFECLSEDNNSYGYYSVKLYQNGISTILFLSIDAIVYLYLGYKE